MNDKQKRFVIEYCREGEGQSNATQAAIRAGYSKDTASSQAFDLLRKPEIGEAIRERYDEIATAASITVEAILKQWWMIATADPNDLMQLQRVNCRYCWGFDHNYQWTREEYSRAADIAATKGKEVPDGMGGFGFIMTREANPKCPECGGDGAEHLHFADTRKLKGTAKRLYAGVQKTKDGLKILTRDQDGALLNLARYMGMLVERKEISGPNGSPVNLLHHKAEDLTDDQLAALIRADDPSE